MFKKSVYAILLGMALACPVLAQSGNQIAATAAMMSPGDWMQVPQNSTIGLLACQGEANPTYAPCGNSGNRLGYGFSGAWDPTRLKLHFVGADHGEPSGIFGVSSSTGTASAGTVSYPNVAYLTCNIAGGGGSCTGSGATFNVAKAGGVYTVTINTAGHLYNAGNNLEFVISGALLDGTDPANNVTAVVQVNVGSYLTFDAATNNWTHECGPGTATDPCTIPVTHGYQHSSVDPITGTFYYKAAGDLGSYPIKLYTYPVGGPWALHNSGVVYEQFSGTAWWDGPLTGADAGYADGTWVEYNQQSANGEFIYYRPHSGTFIDDNNVTPGSASTYNNVITYLHRCNCAVFGGGGLDKKIWRLNSNRTATALPDSPIQMGIQTSNAVEDPVTGHLLLAGVSNYPTNNITVLYDLDPVTGTWTEMTTDVPPANINGYNPPGKGLISFPVPNYGVVAYVSCAASTCTMWLYKRAEATFVNRCAAPGVLRCFGFNDDADFNVGAGGAVGASGGSNTNWGILPVNGTSVYTFLTRDISEAASGASSLRYRMPTNVGSDNQSWFTNFSTDLSALFGENTDFYVQWRQRFDTNYITEQRGGGGWKQAIIGSGDTTAGDATGALFRYSCTELEVVTQNTETRELAQMYNACNVFAPLDEPYGPFDHKIQNAREDPFCLANNTGNGGQDRFPPVGNCIGYFAGEWMTFQVHIHVGAQGTAGSTNASSPGNPGYVNSHVDLWIGREGSASEMAMNRGPYDLYAYPGFGTNYGKVWLLPYSTGRGTFFTTSGTTVTASSAVFTAAMAGGTTVVYTDGNCTPGNYVIASYSSPTSITLTTTPNAAGVGCFMTPPYPESFTWYDDLVISRHRIADPFTESISDEPPPGGERNKHLRFRLE